MLLAATGLLDQLLVGVQHMSLYEFVKWALVIFLVTSFILVTFNMAVSFMSSTLKILRRVMFFASIIAGVGLILLWIFSPHRECVAAFEEIWRVCPPTYQAPASTAPNR